MKKYCIIYCKNVDNLNKLTNELYDLKFKLFNRHPNCNYIIIDIYNKCYSVSNLVDMNKIIIFIVNNKQNTYCEYLINIESLINNEKFRKLNNKC